MEKILVIINNSLACYDQYAATGSMPAIKRRVVEIELTKDQQASLYTRAGEEIESISVPYNKTPEKSG